MKPIRVLLILVVLLTVLTLQPAQAAGVVTTCDEPSLDAALVGGGLVTFACSGTITITSTKVISANTIIDATGQSVTISGANAVRCFEVLPGVTLDLINLTVANCRSASTTGGGVQVQNLGTLNITSSTFSNNSAFTGGGGVYSAGGTVNVTASTFSGNHVNFHGAGIRSNGTLMVSNSVFTTNTTGDGGNVGIGAGIFVETGTATVNTTTFSNNTASNSGGAITNGATVTITNSTFNNNVGNNLGGGNGAGAIDNVGMLIIANSTFANNSTGTQGGAIRNANASTVDVTNSTFSGNSAPSGGVIFQVVGGTATFKNTILANSPSGGNCAGSPIIDGGNNLQFPGTTCGITIPSADPMLGPLANNGGPTQTMSLNPGSPAIDAGNNVLCAAPPVNNMDQRGVARPQDGNGDSIPVCDIGAYEVAAVVVPTDTPIPPTFTPVPPTDTPIPPTFTPVPPTPTPCDDDNGVEGDDCDDDGGGG